MKKKIFYSIFLLFFVLILSACAKEVISPENGDYDNNQEEVIGGESFEKDCTDVDGNWLSEFQECEYIEKDWCVEMEGEFDECTSACRHDELAEMCIDVCVPVCAF